MEGAAKRATETPARRQGEAAAQRPEELADRAQQVLGQPGSGRRVGVVAEDADRGGLHDEFQAAVAHQLGHALMGEGDKPTNLLHRAVEHAQ